MIAELASIVRRASAQTDRSEATLKLFFQDIVKELARISSSPTSSEPEAERRSSGGVAFTAGEVKQSVRRIDQQDLFTTSGCS